MLSAGKTLELKNQASILLVPHRYFTFFYITGFLFNLLCLMDLIFFLDLTESLIGCFEEVISQLVSYLPLFHFSKLEIFKFNNSQPLLPSLLLHLQLTRRLLESLFLTRHDDSKMHIAHLLFALCYYPILSLSLNITFHQTSTISNFIAVLLFVWASFHQLKCHKILADLRSTNPGVYGIPYGDWFAFVSSPHYLAEFLIYVALFIASGWGYLLGLNCLYQLLNFTLICTPPTHAWYLKKFENYPKERKIFIPYIY